MTEFEKALRLTIAKAEEHFRDEYIISLTLGQRKRNCQQEFALGVAHDPSTLSHFSESGASLVESHVFHERFGRFPCCIIHYHVKGQSRSEVVNRLLKAAKQVAKRSKRAGRDRIDIWTLTEPEEKGSEAASE